MTSPILRTSLSRFSLPARPWSIFRWAIERTSRPIVYEPSGRSVVSSSKRTIMFLPWALAVIIAASAHATSSRGFIACSGPWEIPTEIVSLPAGPKSNAFLEVAVVVEAGERIGLRLVLEAGADLRVVERERGGVGEASRELELVVAEGGVLTEAVHVQRRLDEAAGDQRPVDDRVWRVF